jgi:hypothetical protein
MAASVAQSWSWPTDTLPVTATNATASSPHPQASANGARWREKVAIRAVASATNAVSVHARPLGVLDWNVHQAAGVSV